MDIDIRVKASGYKGQGAFIRIEVRFEPLTQPCKCFLEMEILEKKEENKLDQSNKRALILRKLLYFSMFLRDCMAMGKEHQPILICCFSRPMLHISCFTVDLCRNKPVYRRSILTACCQSLCRVPNQSSFHGWRLIPLHTVSGPNHGGRRARGDGGDVPRISCHTFIIHQRTYCRR